MAPKKPQTKPKPAPKPKPKKKAGTKPPKLASGKPIPKKAAVLAADEPDCLSMDDAANAVLDCVNQVSSGGDVDLGTSISVLFPGDKTNKGLRRLLACIKTKTGFDLPVDDFAGGDLQKIADRLACDGDNS
jgi:hypothetical protein